MTETTHHRLLREQADLQEAILRIREAIKRLPPAEQPALRASLGRLTAGLGILPP